MEILGIEPNRDHVPLLFESNPSLNLLKYINALNPSTSRELRRTFPEVTEQLWWNACWARSYFLASTG